MMSPPESPDVGTAMLTLSFGTILTSMGIEMGFFENNDPKTKKEALVCGSIGFAFLGISGRSSYETISNYPIESLRYAWVPLLAFALPFAVVGIKNHDTEDKKIEKTIASASLVTAVFSYVVAFALKA